MNKILIVFALLLFNCNSSAQKQKAETENTYKINKTEAQWRAQLSDMAYHVLREAGTERAFSSPLNNNKKQGVYACKACKTPVFKSEHKFDSGTGWPSFDREIEGNVAFSTDNDLGYTRTEEHCATCGGHLGHVFKDGPRDTTGERHCINGVALTFIPKE
ncbi:peptide-methionine (R)-S-oxide reductase MsrB [Tamlana sp. 2_MG-2023]|uniref:peptide-methionine (R)-S-oxide reductase MsrB n=1 Tax=unclassified Tamlana TaxID=2614803 RepID=UPI0026E3E329|nr:MULTISPECIES: peptide-methionine (R)-S-oxide reductase MsrB [unclassified Tamlana]MDO6761566.1 peptide-methionine (R)-S-oxide reductase MsrB [Tamlana sp. 2_MG-2023]MDO6792304.1 peptide-methionine (R)-S-oxide reductase MsrB [Tamlana sp. 1_MG-2023]